MQSFVNRSIFKDPTNMFCLGLAVVLLCLSFPLIPEWRTFIHMWRTELFASVFLFATLVWLLFRCRSTPVSLTMDRREMLLIVAPISAFILWSAISTAWAPSWRSAIHHTVVWVEYLTFYLVVRSLIDRRGYKKLLATIALAFVIVSLPAIVEYAALLVFGGATSIGIRYARYGEQINTLVPLVFAAVLGLRGKQFTIGLAAMAALWLLIFVSLGRTNIVLFACAIGGIGACVFLFQRFHQYRLKVVIAILVLIAAPVPIHLFSLLSDDPNIPVVRRVSDDSAISSSNGFRKIMASIALEMLRKDPLTGVGADNFGTQVNAYRAVYAEENPTDPNLINAENEIPERTHNEYLQILAELGIVGGLLIAWLLVGVGVMAFRALRHQRTLTGLAALAGVSIFLVSSLVTSYSFRLIQNGFVFFFVLAVAARLLLKNEKGANSPSRLRFTTHQLRGPIAVGILGCVILAAYCAVRVTSVIYTAEADKAIDLEKAESLYQRAIAFDPENPDPEFNLGFRLMVAKSYDRSAHFFEQSIAKGRAPSVSYSYLSTAYLKSGDYAAARSFSRAVKIYPLSPFVQTRYAFILKESRDEAKFAVQMAKARALNHADSTTWLTLMQHGALRASEEANKDGSISPVMDLTPMAAIYAILNERIIDHPEEKSTVDFMK